MASTSGMRGMVTLLLLMLSGFPAVLGDADFVARTCDTTAHPDACLSVLGGDPRSLNATTVLTLAGIGLDAAAAHAGDSAAAMGELSDEKYTGTAEGDALTQCAQLYGYAVEHLGEAREELYSGAYDEASSLVSAAEDAGGACEKAFADRGVGSVVGDVDGRMAERCSVAWDLIDLLNV
ncbi:hypothetical protein ACP70R_030311 [Stipagrostis hirtigluma subsp. patula]